MSLMSTVTIDPLRLADMPAITPKLLRQAAGKQAGERLALLFAVDDGLVEQAEALQRPLGAGRDALGQLHEDRLDLGVDGLGRAAAGPRRWP